MYPTKHISVIKREMEERKFVISAAALPEHKRAAKYARRALRKSMEKFFSFFKRNEASSSLLAAASITIVISLTSIYA